MTLEYFFLKYEGRGGGGGEDVKLTPLTEITTRKNPSFIRDRHVYEYPSITKAHRCILRQYSEPFHGQDSFNQAQFSHIQEYSEPCLTLVYAETWHIWNPEMFKNLP